MKRCIWLFVATLGLTGCATVSPIWSRVETSEDGLSRLRFDDGAEMKEAQRIATAFFEWKSIVAGGASVVSESETFWIATPRSCFGGPVGEPFAIEKASGTVRSSKWGDATVAQIRFAVAKQEFDVSDGISKKEAAAAARYAVLSSTDAEIQADLYRYPLRKVHRVFQNEAGYHVMFPFHGFKNPTYLNVWIDAKTGKLLGAREQIYK